LTDGGLRVVPNGQVSEFVNLSTEWARAIVDVGVPRDVNVDRALALLKRIGEDWTRERDAALLESPRAQGIIKFSGGDVVLRLTVTVAGVQRTDTEFELRRRIKEAFDREGWSLIGTS